VTSLEEFSMRGGYIQPGSACRHFRDVPAVEHPGRPPISMLTAGDRRLMRPAGRCVSTGRLPGATPTGAWGGRNGTSGSMTITPLDSGMNYQAGELAADRVLHMTGTLAGAVGSAILVSIAAGIGTLPIFSASLVYSICLLAMLGCSAAYNLAFNTSRREFLRQLDHAAIFLMIAGTYTPFTMCRLHGVWAIGMTAAVWTGAVTGAVIKLTCPHRIERVSTTAYLALGWIILVGLRPLLNSIDVQTAVLIGVGGVLYSVGAGFYLWRALPFHNAIWHSFVLVAASCHYAAILHGVVLARS
jgi:hemolysin III